MAASSVCHENQAARHAAKIMRGSAASLDPQLQQDYELLVKGHAIYLNEFFGGRHDFSILTDLCKDLESRGEGMINWSKHFKHENPDFSPTFQRIVEQLSDYFDLDVYATRLNFYPNNASWKPFHHDSHAYGGRKLREDLTVGASFGATRSLVFKHVGSERQFGFPQQNGDIFAFTTKVNTQFMHGVPKETELRTGPRFSIIAWGRRRTINVRNGGTDEIGTRDTPEEADSRDDHLRVTKHAGTKSDFSTNDDAPIEDDVRETAAEIRDITELVDRFVLRETAQRQRLTDAKAKAKDPSASSKRRKGRVQGGWGGGSAGRTSGRASASRNGRGRGRRTTDNSAAHRSSRGRGSGMNGGPTGRGRTRVALEASYSDDDD